MPVGYGDRADNGGTGTFGDFIIRPDEGEGRGWSSATASDPLAQAMPAARPLGANRGGVLSMRRKLSPQPVATRTLPQAQSVPIAAAIATKPRPRVNRPVDAKLEMQWTLDAASPLKLIAKHRDKIQAAALDNGVDPVAIGAVIYQEKYNGPFWTWLKDVWPDYNADHARKDLPKDKKIHGKPWHEGSIGLAEMKISTAARLMRKNLADPKQASEVIAALRDDDTAIDLIAKYIAENQQAIGRKLTPLEAGVGHNAGLGGLRAYIRGDAGLGKVPVRGKWQESNIDRALHGELPEPVRIVPRIN